MATANYISLDGNEWPITLQQIRERVNMLFGAEPTPEVLAAAKVAPVMAVAGPTYDANLYTLQELKPMIVNGVWSQRWDLVPLPPLPTIFADISDRQFFQALAMPPYNIITQQESLDAVRTGEIPQVMQTVIDSLPVDQQYPVTMLISGAQTFRRDNPFVPVFGASQGMDEAAINKFWRIAEKL